MKRKADNSLEHNASKASLLTKILREENVDVDEIEKDVIKFQQEYDSFIKKLNQSLSSNEKLNVVTMGKEILQFKELNRKAQFRLTLSREKTKETKDNINKNHLMMQNLLYEALHLQKETEACLDYKCLHDSIELIPLEEFLVNAPEKYRQYEGEHELTLNRLYWELDERKRLTDEIDEAEKLEKELIEEISNKKEAYSNVGTHLKAVLNSTRPLEEVLGIPMHEAEEQQELVQNLPEPLYVVFMRLRSDSDLNKNMNILIKAEINCVNCEIVLINTNIFSLKFYMENKLIRVAPYIKLGDYNTALLCNVSKNLLDNNNLFGDISVSSLHHSDLISWCQQLGGLYEHHKTHVDGGAKNLKIYDIISSICDQMTTRILLSQHLDEIIASKCFSNCVSLYNWELLNEEKFEEEVPAVASRFNDPDTRNNRFIIKTLLQMNNKSMGTKIKLDSLRAWIMIPKSYPATAPCIALLPLSNKIIQAIPGLGGALQMLETEINIYRNESMDSDDVGSTMNVLYKQLNHLCNAAARLFTLVNTDSLDTILVANKFPVSSRPFNVK